jgi:hypothetical protein
MPHDVGLDVGAVQRMDRRLDPLGRHVAPGHGVDGLFLRVYQ